MWFKTSFRRHLCDMHIDDWDPTFLSEFDPEVYVACLKKAKLQNAMLYFQSHVGLCYYPTASGKMHKAFVGREDAMRRLVDLCHENGITVTGYYSLIYNTVEHDRHPEWRMVSPNGRSKRDEKSEIAHGDFTDAAKGARYGLCCPNNPGYRDFVATQIREMAEYFTVEGMFYDMLFWPHMCHCEHCKARWAREVGGELPAEENWSDARWLLHMHKRREWMGEFAHWVTDLTKSLIPGVSVEHNVAFSALPSSKSANCEEVVSACDYAGGDLYHGVYSHSFVCKFYRSITQNQPFEFMLTRCSPGLSTHTQLKSLDVLRSATAVTAANHGATLVIDAIDPVGTLDARVYERLGQVFGEFESYDAYMKGKPMEELGLYYSLKSKFNPRGEKMTNYAGALNTVETAVGANILCGVTGTFHDLNGYKVLMAPMLTDEDRADLDRIVNYVQNGGSLYFSGGDCGILLEKFFGAKVKGRTVESEVYISPTDRAGDIFGHYNKKYPLQFKTTAPILDTAGDADVLATVTLPYTNQGEIRFASIHSNPPGISTEIPAMLTKNFGKGRVVWSAFPIECLELYDHREILLNLLVRELGFASSLRSTAPDDVEITVFEADDGLLLHTVLMSTKHFARKVENFDVSLDCKKPPKRLVRLPEGSEVPSVITGNTLSFTSTEQGIFATYKIEF